MRWALPLLLASLAATHAFPAQASQEFPPEIDAFLSLGYQPPCTTCHETDLGGFGTVVQPFGQKMRDRGLVAGDLDSLRTALTALDGEGSDVDGDGVGDIDELRAGTDPNVSGDVDGPEYGCLGSVAPTRHAGPGALLSAFAAAAAWARRRRATT